MPNEPAYRVPGVAYPSATSSTYRDLATSRSLDTFVGSEQLVAGSVTNAVVGAASISFDKLKTTLVVDQNTGNLGAGAGTEILIETPGATTSTAFIYIVSITTAAAAGTTGGKCFARILARASSVAANCDHAVYVENQGTQTMNARVKVYKLSLT